MVNESSTWQLSWLTDNDWFVDIILNVKFFFLDTLSNYNQLDENRLSVRYKKKAGTSENS